MQSMGATHVLLLQQRLANCQFGPKEPQMEDDMLGQGYCDKRIANISSRSNRSHQFPIMHVEQQLPLDFAQLGFEN